MSASTIHTAPESHFSRAHFSNTWDVLTSLITQSEFRIISCVDAACSPAWFKLMLACRRRGLEVTLIVRAIEQNLHSGLAWERLVAMGVQLVWLQADNTSLRTSACVIDQSVAVSGNFEPVNSVAESVFSGIVIQNLPHAVTACLEGLNQLLQSVTGAVDVPLTDLRKTTPHPLASQLVLSADPTVQVMAWQLGLLADHSMALDEEIADMHQKINAFDNQQDDAIGEVVGQYLDLKQRYLSQLYQESENEEQQIEAQAAQADFAQFRSKESQPDQPPPAEPLGATQQEDIKHLYRKLTMLCHPDRVQEQHKLQAQELFQRVQSSYRNFDFSVLKTIEQQLQQVPFGGISTAADSFMSLKQRLADLQERLSTRCVTHRHIQQSPTWRTLSTQSNWDVWFAKQDEYLRAEIQRYSLALEVIAQPAP
jgi:hypothetical protein